MLDIATNLNRRFDRPLATGRLKSLDIPLKRRVGKLSGGQQAQLALTLALARHPDLLVLDEPLARLDPVARHDVMALVMATTAEEGLSVILSSHVVSELERVADHLILVAKGRLQLVGAIDDLLSQHAVLNGPADGAERIGEYFCVVRSERAVRRAQLLVRHDEPIDIPGGWEAYPPTLDELVLAYLRDPSVSGYTGSLAIAATRANRMAP
jgi:ABC-2 type transport system ATP-binding protein